MITVSNTAKEKIMQLAQEAQLNPPWFLRVSVVGGGCSGLSYKMDFDDELRKDDQVFEDQGIKLVCDIKSFLYLCGTQLDYSGGLQGKGFHFVNPNATRTCSCGESFAV